MFNYWRTIILNQSIGYIEVKNFLDSNKSSFRYYPNKTNEQVVIRFLTGAMDGKVQGLGKGTAKEWWRESEQARKIATLMEHDHSLAGDAFRIGNMDRGFDPMLSVLPVTEVKPRLLDVSARNEQALKTIQSFLTCAT